MTENALMDWTGPNNALTYTLTQGTCHAKVWYSSVDGWVASIMYRASTFGQMNFTTLHDAQAWGETQLTKLVNDGQCARASWEPGSHDQR
jgi:hypothetical protein